jgi:hypothetical protein
MVKWLEDEDNNRAQVAGESGPAEVGVVERGSTKYLRTHADGQWSDNLLSLPRF